MTATSVILVSDTHLSPRTPEAGANWNAVLRHVEAAAPDLVIHLGDLSLDGANDPGEMAYGREQLGRLPAAWHAVPGNHDVGDNPWPGAPAGHAIDAQRRQRWLDAVGPDRWALTAGGWTLLAVNAQLLGSGLDAEAGQWDWLQRQLADRDAGAPVALLTHKPVTASPAELAGAPPFRFWPETARDRLAGLLGGVLPDLVISGHVHQRRLLRLDGTDHLWAPTTWAVLPDDKQPVLGAKRCGIVTLEFPDDGSSPRPEFTEPAGITQHTLLRDLPDPYGR